MSNRRSLSGVNELEEKFIARMKSETDDPNRARTKYEEEARMVKTVELTNPHGVTDGGGGGTLLQDKCADGAKSISESKRILAILRYRQGSDQRAHLHRSNTTSLFKVTSNSAIPDVVVNAPTIKK